MALALASCCVTARGQGSSLSPPLPALTFDDWMVRALRVLFVAILGTALSCVAYHCVAETAPKRRHGV